MATTTPNLGLTKPAVSDAADISVLNANFDKIDYLGGYGLGTAVSSTPVLSDTNAAGEDGWYLVDSATANYEKPSGVMRVDAHVKNWHVHQVVYTGNWSSQYPVTLERWCRGGVWDVEWSWVNPPMAIGTEYRTTEYWNNGKPVYTKLVDCGQVTDGKTVYYSVDGMTRLIRHAAKITTATFGDINLPYIYGDMGSSYTAYCYVNAASCGFKVGANATGQGYLQIWYTKD